MSYTASGWARKSRGQRSAGEKLVLMVLADYCGFDTGECWPSQVLLADDCGMTRRSVITALARLERRGLITRLSKGGRKGPSHYRLNVDAQIGETGCTNQVKRTTQSGETSDTEQVKPTTQTGETDATPPYNPPIRRTVNEPVNNRLSERQLKRLRLMEQEKLRWEG